MKLLLSGLALVAGGTAIAWSGGDRALADDLGYDAVVQPHRVLQLGSASDGLLESVLFDRGDRVELGDVVATLDVRVAQAQAALARARAERDSALRMVEARLTDARRRLAVQEALRADGIAMNEAVDTLRTEVRLEELALAQQCEEQAIAQLELQRVQATLAQATITSPIDGVVVDRGLSPGEFYSRTGQRAVLTVAELDPLVVEVNVPLEHFDAIRVGDLAGVRLDSVGNPLLSAKVHTKDRVVDTASRTFQVRLHLSNADYALPAGLRCRVNFRE